MEIIDPADDAMTFGRAARELGVEANHIWRLVSAGKLKRSDHCPGGHLAVTGESVRRLRQDGGYRAATGSAQSE